MNPGRGGSAPWPCHRCGAGTASRRWQGSVNPRFGTDGITADHSTAPGRACRNCRADSSGAVRSPARSRSWARRRRLEARECQWWRERNDEALESVWSGQGEVRRQRRHGGLYDLLIKLAHMLVGHAAIATQHHQHRRDRCAIALRCIAFAVDGDRETQIAPAAVGRKARADQSTGAPAVAIFRTCGIEARQ